MGVSMPSNRAVLQTANPSILGIMTSKMAAENRCERRLAAHQDSLSRLHDVPLAFQIQSQHLPQEA